MLTEEEKFVLEDQGNINPETNRPWHHPMLGVKNELFRPRLIFTDLPRGWNNENDESWFYRHWPSQLDASALYEPEMVQIEASTMPKNDALLLRMSDYWNMRKQEFDTINDNVWAKNTFLLDNIRILDATLGIKDLDLSHELFSNLHSSSLCEGMQQGYQAEFWLKNFKIMMPKYTKLIQDRIISLAEFVGAVSVQCPEQGGHSFYLDINEIIEAVGIKISQIAGPVGFPVYQGGLIGIKTIAGIVDERQLSSLYIALKIHEKFRDNKQAKICDLGAGNGLVLFWLYQLGYQNLYAVDLPHVSLLQVYNLSTHFGMSQVKFGHESTNAPITILSMDQYFNYDYDLVVNSDSLPEIDYTWASKYLQHINEHSKFFFSINQETMFKNQINVQHAINENYKNLHCISRNRFWMRPGYIEEWYQQK